MRPARPRYAGWARSPTHRQLRRTRQLHRLGNIEWFDAAEVRRMVLDGDINDGLSFGGLLYAITAGAI